MNVLFPSGPGPAGREPSKTVRVDPTLGEEEARVRWEARAAQWRARELAEGVFGGRVAARLTGRSTRAAFRGLLHLEVPFEGLERHRAKEAAFLAAAADDLVLTRVPLVFVLSPAAP